MFILLICQRNKKTSITLHKNCSHNIELICVYDNNDKLLAYQLTTWWCIWIDSRRAVHKIKTQRVAFCCIYIYIEWMKIENNFCSIMFPFWYIIKSLVPPLSLNFRVLIVPGWRLIEFSIAYCIDHIFNELKTYHSGVFKLTWVLNTNISQIVAKRSSLKHYITSAKSCRGTYLYANDM